MISELSSDYRERWDSFLTGSLAEANKKNTVDLVGQHPLQSSSEDDDSDFRGIPFPQEAHMQQVGRPGTNDARHNSAPALWN